MNCLSIQDRWATFSTSSVRWVRLALNTRLKLQILAGDIMWLTCEVNAVARHTKAILHASIISLRVVQLKLTNRHRLAATMSTKIILFELNEVPWRVIRDYTRDYPESTLARLLPKLRKYETHTEDEELNPWATWPSVHRGVADKYHNIVNFGQDLSEINEVYPPVWDIVSKAGVRTGVFGSFHTYPPPINGGQYDYYVPDVFAIGSECFPQSIEKFQDWQLAMARSSARSVDKSLPIKKTLRFLMGITAARTEASYAFESRPSDYRRASRELEEDAPTHAPSLDRVRRIREAIAQAPTVVYHIFLQPCRLQYAPLLGRQISGRL